MTCRDARRLLAAYQDEELTGAGRLAVSAHVDGCVECAGELADLRALGELLRGSVVPAPAPEVLAGLAPGVVSRIAAEDRQSWRACGARLFEDWHWVATGSGAFSAAFISALLVFAMLYSPTTQARQLNEKVGTLYVMAVPEGGQGQPVVLEYERTLGESKSDPRYAMPASLGWRAEQALVSQLDRSLMRHGSVIRFDRLSREEREEISNLVQEIGRMRQESMRRLPSGPTRVTGMHLHVTEVVTAAGL